MQSVKNMCNILYYTVLSLSLTHSMPERGSLGLRFFSHSKSNSQRRQMKSCLSAITMKTRSQIDRQNRNEEEASPHVEREREYLLSSLRYSSTVCTTMYVQCMCIMCITYMCVCVCSYTINSLNHSHTTIIHSYSLIYTHPYYCSAQM